MRNLANIASTVGVFVMAATPMMAVASLARAEEARAVHIQLADLPTGAAGTAAFNRRVDAAAHTLCRASSGPVDLAITAACENDVREQARDQVRRLRAGSDAAPAWTVAGR
jgi:UrcA family protein